MTKSNRYEDDVRRTLMGDDRPKKGGWAPGAYWHSKCRQCGREFIGDKRAWLCAECAYNGAQEAREKP